MWRRRSLNSGRRSGNSHPRDGEKTITATAITLGYLQGDIPQRLMILIVFTNWLWIPFIVWADVAVARASRRMSQG